jgi:hypothetical protein
LYLWCTSAVPQTRRFKATKVPENLKLRFY